jgi:predicted RNase H-like nuclease (RuvC/YqgF family)
MCGHRHHRHGRRGRRFPNREEWIQRLEERQRDLEQEIADLADVIKQLKSGDTPAGATAL